MKRLRIVLEALLITTLCLFLAVKAVFALSDTYLASTSGGIHVGENSNPGGGRIRFDDFALNPVSHGQIVFGTGLVNNSTICGRYINGSLAQLTLNSDQVNMYSVTSEAAAMVKDDGDVILYNGNDGTTDVNIAQVEVTDGGTVSVGARNDVSITSENGDVVITLGGDVTFPGY